MEKVLIQLIQAQGVWAVLFVFMLLYTIRKNDRLDEIQERREEKYQRLLLELTEKLSVLNTLSDRLHGKLKN
ncbi:hypothetical protein J2S20_000017 [Moryella indoligenes]|uniref:Bacteriocin UviB n=1 Tax=Moryella indoligenes TaxID=371674 RepID=A0AAE4AJ33_9FIRM|nr:BhlA/UviB family holin-like peptide [Moryella indoligenes]MDQ0151343.1 hypothetical protein [Moryella indoligenes]